jgi:hypothetical protein
MHGFALDPDLEESPVKAHAAPDTRYSRYTCSDASALRCIRPVGSRSTAEACLPDNCCYVVVLQRPASPQTQEGPSVAGSHR